jgi:DNA repair protein RadC
MTSEPFTLSDQSATVAKILRKEIQPSLIDARSYRTAQIMVRTVCEAVTEEPPIMSKAELIAAFFRSKIETAFDFNPDVEGFWVFMLDRKNRLKMFTRCTEGTATAALAHPREVFRAAVVSSACTIVCAHNHPSGDPAPSSADVQITHLLREAGKTLEISVIDHVIIGRTGADPMGKGFYSFREAGLL